MAHPKGYLYSHNGWEFFQSGGMVKATGSHGNLINGFADPKHSHDVVPIKDWPEMKKLIDIGRYY